MLLKALDIERFGLFRNRKIGPLAPGLNVVFGPNEAGKTTLLKFVRYLLFGFPSGQSFEAKENDYRLDPGDTLGGRLTVAAGPVDGPVTVERFSGKGAGQVVVHLPDGEKLGEEFLQKMLGHVTGDLYRNLFAFGLAELSDFGSLSEESLQARIYSAGAGTGAVALPQVLAQLDKECQELFKPKGAKQEINLILSELKKIDQELKELASQTDQYDLLVVGREGLNRDLARLNDLESACQKELERLNTLKKAWDKWISYFQAEMALNKLEPLPENFPEQALETLGELERHLEEENSKLRELENQIGQEKAKLISDPELEKLYELRDRLDPLKEGYKEFVSAMADLPDLRNQFKTESDALDTLVKGLNPSWTLENVLQFDMSIPAQNRVRNVRERMGQAGSVQKGNLSGAFYQLFLVMVVLGAGGWLVVTGTQVLGWLLVAAAALYLFFWWRNRSAQEAARKDLRELLDSMGLDHDLSPETVQDIFGQVKEARNVHKNLMSLKGRIERVENSIKRYCELAGTLYVALGKPSPRKEEVIGAVKHLLDRASAAQEHQVAQLQIRKNLDFLQDQKKKQQKSCAGFQEEIGSLLARGCPELSGPQAREGFLHLAEVAADRKKYLDRHLEARSFLAAMAGGESKLQDFLDQLRDTREETLIGGISSLEEKREGNREQIKEINQKLGELKNQIEQLGTQTRLSELRLERATAVERLSLAAGQWAVLSLAAQMIRKATARYEKDRQPEVIRHGQEFFEGLTEGRYTRIFAPLGSQSIEVAESESGRRLTPGKLSRGTAEQLYLALRFGLVREFSRHSEPLPLIMDDILVNFDDRRAQSACGAIRDIASSHQVLYFTCHSHIRELIRSLAPEVNVLDLGSD